jgi:hypothetical protein
MEAIAFRFSFPFHKPSPAKLLLLENRVQETPHRSVAAKNENGTGSRTALSLAIKYSLPACLFQY